MVTCIIYLTNLLYRYIQKEVPEPPADNSDEDPKLELNKVENIVYAIYTIASKVPDITEGQEMNSRFVIKYFMFLQLNARSILNNLDRKFLDYATYTLLP